MKVFHILLLLLFNVGILSDISGQDLTQDETLEYLRTKCTVENNYRKTLPNNQAGTKVVDYEFKLDYEYLVVYTIIDNGEKRPRKFRLKDAEINFKYIEPKTYKLPNEIIQSYGGYQLYIGYEGVPAFIFTNKEDADNMINALNYLKKFCKVDPFSKKQDE